MKVTTDLNMADFMKLNEYIARESNKYHPGDREPLKMKVGIVEIEKATMLDARSRDGPRQHYEGVEVSVADWILKEEELSELMKILYHKHWPGK